MENASKALLIAAAVLIVILIIAFGMRVINSTGGASGQAEAVGKSQEVLAFNAQFTPYIGEGLTYSAIQNLQAAIKTSNSIYTNFQVENLAIATGVTVKDGGRYTIKITATHDDGRIKQLTITK